jgi:hypothetical protein
MRIMPIPDASREIYQRRRSQVLVLLGVWAVSLYTSVRGLNFEYASARDYITLLCSWRHGMPAIPGSDARLHLGETAVQRNLSVVMGSSISVWESESLKYPVSWHITSPDGTLLLRVQFCHLRATVSGLV